ncbi:hypothetical protein DXG01_002731 [Tephrocybe rancida]|nr:hypothetical protein DXG01_002731 [Tephrocybe rancida]
MPTTNGGPDGQPNNLTTTVNEVAKPTCGEYAGEAAKGFLSILETVAQAVPVPGLSIVVNLSLNIIKACEEGHASLERAQELKLRIKALVLTLVNELKGKKEGEIRVQTIQDIGTLGREFYIIQMQLNEIASQHPLRLILFKSLNNDKVRRCVIRLDTSLESFGLARNIEHAIIFTKLEQQIAMFYAHQQQNTQTLNKVHAQQQQDTQTLNEVHGQQQQNTRTLNDMQLSIVDVKAMFAQGSPAHLTSPTRALIPANTHIFHGRDTLVTKLVGVLVRGSRQHICLLGPGGMGKTSTSLAVMNHPDVEARFAEHLHVWVPCVKAPSTSVLFNTLCTSLGISIKSGNPFSDILSVLRTSSPIVLVFDNFETPWNAGGGQSEHRRACLEDVAEKYKVLGTAVMGQGLDAKTSMDVCIGLSVNSPRMTAHPEAFDLLCTIAMLPAGTSYKALFCWWARDLIGVLGVLKDTSLVEQNGSTLFVLPVIQRYILHDSRFSKQVGILMLESACQFLEAHASNINDKFFKSHSAAMSAEEGNLEAVLLMTPEIHATQDGFLLHVIQDGFLLLARHQQHHSARVNIIEHALHLARHIDDDLLQGDLLFCYGDSLCQVDQGNMASKHLEAALCYFLSASDRKRAAKCRLKLFDAMQGQAGDTFERYQEIIVDAQADCKATGDEGLAACCLLYLGILNYKFHNDSTALDLLTQVEPVLAQVKDWEHHAECSCVSLWVHYYMGQYDLAYTCAASALEECDHIGDAQGCAGLHNHIGRIHSAHGNFEGSLRSYLCCLEVLKSLGLPPWSTALRGMGLAWAKLGKVQDACQAFKESLQQLAHPDAPAPSPITQRKIACTQLFLHRLENPALVPTPEEYDALQGWYSDDHIEKILAPVP